MKARLFILKMLLIPFMFGCSKESYTIVGEWYIYSTEYSDSSNPERYYFEEYTKENSFGFVSFTADGRGVTKVLDEGGQGILDEMKFHWTLSNDKLTITPEGSNQSSSGVIVFEGNDKYYMVMQHGTVSEKIVWKRM